jgi:hypothetical protein
MWIGGKRDIPGLVDFGLGIRSVLVTELLELVEVSTDLLLQVRARKANPQKPISKGRRTKEELHVLVVQDVFSGITCKGRDLLECILEDGPAVGSGLERESVLFRDGLELVVRLGDDLVDFIAVLLSNDINVLECGIYVGFSTGDEFGVAVGGFVEPFEGLVGLGCFFL